MEIVTPVFLDVFLIYRYFYSTYKLKSGKKTSALEMIAIIIADLVIINLISTSLIDQICAYIVVMPIIISIFKGRMVIRIIDYMKMVLAFCAINLFAVYISLYIESMVHKNMVFLLFFFFAITLRLFIFFLLTKGKHHHKIQYFEIAKYKDILIKFIIVFVFLIIMTSLTLDQEIIGGKGSFGQLRAMLLIFLIILLLSIYENIEEVVGNLIEKMMHYQQEEIKQNYLGVISEKTQELSTIKHDIRDHMFMVTYLVEKGNLEEVKKYLDNITLVETGLMLIPQKEWLNSLVYSKVKTAQKRGIVLEVRNEWEKDLSIEIDDMDMLSLFSNLMNNAIDALEHVVDVSKQKSVLTLKQKKDYLIIDIFNYFNTQYLIHSKGKLQTTKKDKKIHGKGMNIIKDITAKYNGGFEYKLDTDKIIIETTLQNKRVEK